MEFAPKELKIKADIEGISLKALSEHYKLYEGYVKKTNEIQKKMESVDKSLPNATYSEIGELKRQESFAVNGMKLHEIYFGALGGDGKPEGKAAGKIVECFGSIENWVIDMTAAGLSSRGWVITAQDLNDGLIHNYSADAHNLGTVYGAVPLVALDVYEHAYFMDHGTDRKSYIEAFFKNLDWEAIENNYRFE